MSRYIILTSVRGSGKNHPIRFMVRNIVAWTRPFNGKPGSSVITVDTDETGWHVSETPEEIDAIMDALEDDE